MRLRREAALRNPLGRSRRRGLQGASGRLRRGCSPPPPRHRCALPPCSLVPVPVPSLSRLRGAGKDSQNGLTHPGPRKCPWAPLSRGPEERPPGKPRGPGSCVQDPEGADHAWEAGAGPMANVHQGHSCRPAGATHPPSSPGVRGLTGRSPQPLSPGRGSARSLCGFPGCEYLSAPYKIHQQELAGRAAASSP